MVATTPSQSQNRQQDTGWIVNLGGWLFTRRTSMPLPIVLALLLIPSDAPGRLWGSLGTLIILLGEALRFWAVRQIGAISRTRSNRHGPLVSSGPFAYVRNPLYLGNIAIWTGFSLCAGLAWLAPFIVALLAFVYHAIVRWEEQLLADRLGEPYRDFLTRVPRWIPSAGLETQSLPEARFSWRATLFSERGTLIAIAAGYFLLALKFSI